MTKKFKVGDWVEVVCDDEYTITKVGSYGVVVEDLLMGCSVDVDFKHFNKPEHEPKKSEWPIDRADLRLMTKTPLPPYPPISTDTVKIDFTKEMTDMVKGKSYPFPTFPTIPADDLCLTPYDAQADMAEELSVEPEHVQEPDKHAQRKGQPIFSGCLMYFPDALLAIGECSRIANEQHNAGEPMHWSREKSADHPDALLRHLIDAGTMDDDNILHSTKVAWRALAMLQLELENNE